MIGCQCEDCLDSLVIRIKPSCKGQHVTASASLSLSPCLYSKVIIVSQDDYVWGGARWSGTESAVTEA
jgi:hypothetical protein